MALAKAIIDRDEEDTKLTRLETKITSNETIPLTINAVHLFLKQADEVADRLREVHGRILHLNPTELAEHKTKYQVIDDRICTAIVKLLDIKSNLEPTGGGAPRSHQLQTNVKLPVIHLPNFDGKFEDWPSFEDLFIATIEKNVNLAPVQKLQYLKSCTKGEPHSLIRSFTSTDAHYTEAWTLLQNKYKNLREIIHSLVKKFIFQPKCKGSGAAELQSLLNTTTECIRSLSVQGCSIGYWDDLLVVIIVEKLDSEARSEWAKTLTGTSPPTYEDLTVFLENHIRALLAKGNVNPQPRQNQQQYNPAFNRGGKQIRSHHTGSAPPKCPNCKQTHWLSQCPTFHSLTQQERFQLVNKLSACSNCLSTSHHKKDCTSKYTCRKCQQQHHSLLHRDEGNSSKVFHTNIHSNQPKKPEGPERDITRSHHSSSGTTEATQVLLKTAIVLIEDKNGNKRRCRAFLDDGSESSFITEACASALSLQRQPTDVRVTGVGSTDAAHARWKVNIRLESTVYNAHADIEALVLKQVTGNLPRTTCSPSWAHLKNLPLADPEFYQPSKVDLLLGADVVASIMRPGLHRGPPCSPTATHTLFGWVLSGRVSTQQQQLVRTFHTSIRLDEIAKQIWQESQPPRATTFTKEEKECETHFISTVTRLQGGRYQVRLPFHSSVDKSNISNIGNTRGLAESRLLSLERRFQNHPTHHEEYRKFMKEYLDMGHMQLATTSGSNRPTYIPHHFVIKEDSSTTKLRVVFDASMKSTNGISLNSTMMVGPTLQDDLFSILLRFRMNPIAIKGDIAKMYRQFLIHPDDQDYQRILWRDHPSLPIQEFRLATVTYGTASAPYLATRCLQQLAKDEVANFPEAAAVLLRSMYVDDLLGGGKDIPSTIALIKQLIAVVAKAGMSIRKFCSNSKEVMESIPEELREEVSSLSFDHDDYVKTLGIVWQPVSDTFTFHTNCKPIAATKRILLSEIAKVFDPLGWLSPLTITAKILFQSSWKEAQDWDDQLSPTQLQQWSEYQQQLQLLSHLAIPRFIPHDDKQLQLIGFCDASEKAYAACLYLFDGSSSYLIAAKTKVAPLKQISLPRLELCAALLLSELLESVTEALNMSFEVKCYTDSMIVYKWICSTSRRWKTYVANRVAAIQEIVPPEQWSHIPGIDNPADLPSRGITVEQLINSSMWWHGPSLINGIPRSCSGPEPQVDMAKVLQEERAMPVNSATSTLCNLSALECSNSIDSNNTASMLPNLTALEFLNSINSNTTASMRDNSTAFTSSFHSFSMGSFITTFISRYSSLNKLIRATIILQKFIVYLRPSTKGQVSKLITPANRASAMQSLIRSTQAVFFKEDITHLTKDGQVQKSSSISSLAPFISNGILQVGGRLEKSACQSGQKHPILLSKRSYLTELIVRDHHLRNLHSTIQLTLAAVFHKFWIVGARSYVRLLLRKCVVCRKVKATTMTQQMGQLPAARVTENKLFRHTGVDFAGPYNIRVSSRRNAALQKYWFAVFVCMSTKATHLEPVSSLSSEAFIAAFIRFNSRRGPCAHLYSDCGTNFKGAEKILKKQFATMEEASQTRLSELGITFHFNPPAAPNQGGLWEACVKQVKHHLRRVVGDSKMTIEQFNTLLTQIEACLNSRPLIPRSSDPNDLEPLTPGHFLTGGPIIALPDPDVTMLPNNRLNQWQFIQKMTQGFWKRWHNEYLITMQQRAKWRRPQPNAQIGDLVLIAVENLPTTQWKTGRVIDVHPGADNLVRSATIRTILSTKPLKFSELVRPISKLAIILPDKESE